MLSIRCCREGQGLEGRQSQQTQRPLSIQWEVQCPWRAVWVLCQEQDDFCSLEGLAQLTVGGAHVELAACA